jgi:DNA-binding transcriptional MerR regulator
LSTFFHFLQQNNHFCVKVISLCHSALLGLTLFVMTYTTTQLATLFGVKPQTIRNWAEEFIEYLSPTSKPGLNRNRMFTVDDARVFALVAELKKQKLTYADIHATLQSGERGEPPALPPKDLQLIASSEREQRYSLQIELLQHELARVQNELVYAKGELDKVQELREEKVRLETALRLTQEQRDNLEEQLNEKDEQLDKARHRIEELAKQLGEEYARGVMDALERRGELPRKDA